MNNLEHQAKRITKFHIINMDAYNYSYELVIGVLVSYKLTRHATRRQWWPWTRSFIICRSDSCIFAYNNTVVNVPYTVNDWWTMSNLSRCAILHNVIVNTGSCVCATGAHFYLSLGNDRELSSQNVNDTLNRPHNES